jgi:non-specific serine/threonine protein kinase/serine/threonine-protein kinase
MTPERWQQVKQVLATALEVSPDERPAFLDRNCEGDDSLRHDVEKLLADEHQLSHGFLDHVGLATAAAAILPADESFWIGRRVGPYKITEQIGAGGMGEVYRAVRVDDHYKKEVALKVISAGRHSGFVTDRFRNERQILATLDHPNIAHLLDGGATEDGTLYFVMELIEGQPITEYCQQRRLSVPQRLRLFSQVCAAVQYAHQRLIIHRDIKPGNILVTPEGTPKLLDFGIAKIIGIEPEFPQVDATLTAFRVLTPRYASPEQMKGEPMTTASDVYSLGVVLFELLAARSPYGRATSRPTEMERAVCDVEPERPSVVVRKSESIGDGNVRNNFSERLAKQLSGDLDNIVLMALRKEPARRYQSVEQFAEDIRRHLEDVPILARNVTAWYRTSKFVSRHRFGVIASTVAACALLGGLTVALYEARAAREQAQIARVQRARAERRFNDVRKLANSLMFEIHDSIRDLPGTIPARKLLVNRALEYLDSLSQESSDDLSLQRELAAAYDRVGDVLGYSGAANLGDFTGALQSYKKALAIRETAAAANSNDLQIEGDLLNDYFRLTFALEDAGDHTSALSNLRKALPVAQRLADSRPGDPKFQDWLAGFYWSVGNVLSRTGDYAGALESYRRGLSIREPIARDTSAKLFRTHLAADYYGVGQMLMRTGEIDQAIAWLRKGVPILEQLSQSDPTNATLREFLGESYANFAPMLEKHRDLDEALECDRKALQIFSALVSADPANSLARANLGLSEASIGEVLIDKGRVDDAMPHIHRATAIFEAIDHKNRYDIAGQAQSYLVQGVAYSSLASRETSSASRIERLREARSWYQKSLLAWQEEPDRSALDPFGGEEGDRITRELAKCDAALATLEPRAH